MIRAERAGRIAASWFPASDVNSHGIVLQYVGSGFGRRMLDVGSGSGALAYRLRKQDWRVTTLDKNGFAEVAADLDIDRPAKLGLFDTIVCADVLEHLSDPASVLGWLRTLLLIEGRIVVSLPNVAHISVRLGLLWGRWTMTDRGILDRTHRHFFTPTTAKALLQGAGLRIVKATATPAPISLVWRWWPPCLDRLHARLARAWPSLWGYQSIFLCERERTA